MTTAEPMGIAIALVMTIRATRFHDNPRWRRECAILGAGIVTLILTKELLAPLILLPVVVALTMRRDGTFSTPSRSARNIALFLTVLVATAATMAPVVIIYLSADSSSYASLYGREMQSPVALLAIWLSGLVPFDLVGAPGNAGWLIAFVGATILLAAGWRIGFDFDRRARWLLLIALAVPLAGVLAYTPNPWFARFYLLPYLTGAALLTGMAVTYLQTHGRSATIVAVACWVGMSVYAISTAALLAARTDAVQRRDDRIIAFVHDSHDADTVVIAMARPFPADWVAETSVKGAPRGLGANLRRFSQASDRPWPPTREASCDDGRRTITESRAVIVLNFEESCDLGTDRASHRIVHRFRRFDWSALRLVHDSTQARAFRIPAAPLN
jgi:hypothetical protein